MVSANYNDTRLPFITRFFLGEAVTLKILKNILKNELYLIGLLLLVQVMRPLLMSRDLSIGLERFLLMVAVMAIFSVIQQIVRDRALKKRDNQEEQ